MPEQTIANSIRAEPLDAFRVLIFSGDDRVDFLQGQLTQDMTKLETAGTALTGWASAKGRLLAAGQLVATGDEIWWPLPADIIENVAKRLQMFVLRSAVKIEISTMHVSGIIGVTGHEQLKIAGKSAQLGNQPNHFSDQSLIVRVIGDPDRAWLMGPAGETTGFEPAGESTWTGQSIRSGLPYIVAATQELFVPQMLNQDLIDAISFDKGCYVGQEIVARTQNLGRIKRRMYRFSVDNAMQLSPGAGLYGPDNATGKVVLSSAEELLAVVPIDTATGPWYADKDMTVRLESRPLPYSISDQ